MQKRQIRIRCVYRNPEITLGGLLMEFFRLYLSRIRAE